MRFGQTWKLLTVLGVFLTLAAFAFVNSRLQAQQPSSFPVSAPAEPPSIEDSPSLPADPRPVWRGREARSLAIPDSAKSSQGDQLHDPEAAAASFVERSTKEADDAIKTLSKEAEALRARLEKVETGLARWQAVKNALESQTGSKQTRRRSPAPEATPVRQPSPVDPPRDAVAPPRVTPAPAFPGPLPNLPPPPPMNSPPVSKVEVPPPFAAPAPK
jgi:hypothetical protein